MMAEHTVEILLEECASDDPRRQVVALIELIKLHADVDTAPILRLLSSPDENVREESARALGYLGQNEKAGVGLALMHTLHDSEDLVREEVAKALGLLGYEAAIDPLKALLLTDPSWLVRAAAAEALGNFADGSLPEALEQAFKDEYAPVRAYAAISLGLVASTDFLPRLQALMDAESAPEVRTELLGASYRLGATANLQRLLDTLQTADEGLSMSVFNSLQDLTGWRPPASIRDDAPRIREALKMVVQRFPRLGPHAREIEENLNRLTATMDTSNNDKGNSH